jgi:SecD/SecF fusion protein
MDKSLRNRLLVILAVTIGCLASIFPIEKRINLGLDLKGGMHLILQVETDKLDANAKSDAVLRAIEILRNRIDSLGAGETIIQREGENGILVQLPGITNRDQALALIGKVAQLEFRLVDENPDPNRLKQAIEGNPPAGYVLKYTKDDKTPILIHDKVDLSGETVKDARVDMSTQSFGQPYVSLQFNALGASQFGTLTKNNVGHRLAIILDGEVLSAPNINEAILGGNAQISGHFTMEEASLLALSLRSGALPAPMHIEEERTVGPLLGKDSIEAGIKATVMGLAAVFLFMALYYRSSGMIANVALLMNLLMIVGIMGFLNIMLPETQLTLTLPGIAGIILTLGMAVDANVLINERIREELENGHTLPQSIQHGFTRALSAIIDSHVTSLIAAFFLFQFGSGPIKGFAVTLTIGLLASLFTAVYFSRTLFLVFTQSKIIKKLSMFRMFAHTKINFITYRYVFFAISLVMVVISLTVFFKKGEKAYGIDFAGGQIQEYKFAQAVHADEIRAALEKGKIEDATIQQFEKEPNNVLIRTSGDTYEHVQNALKASFPNNAVEILRIEKVGPVVGKALRKAALWAIICALGGILVYIGFRFKHFDFATAGVIALIYDVIVAMGVILMTGHQIDLLVITALLTIAGYSITDTIVTYDRVRENLIKNKKASLAEIINLSINQTLSRTILTTSVTLLTVISLFLFGGEVLHTFAFCLLVGFMSGAYSTVFIASPLVLAWPKNRKA